MQRMLNRAWKGLAWLLCRVIPLNANKIVVSNYYGGGFGDNAKYIVEKLQEHKCNLEVIWLVKSDEERRSLPRGVKSSIINTFESIYHLSTAMIWIDNCRKWTTLFKRKSQFYIQTWHGGGAQKKVEKDVEKTLDIGYLVCAKKDAEMTDLMISESRFLTELYHRAFWYNGPVYECGYPRYDILLRQDEKLVDKVYNYFGINRNRKLLLYAPTFRADLSFKAYDVDFPRLLRNLKIRFNEDYVVLVHLHPNVANFEGGIAYDGTTIINSTFYPDMQELVAVSSILIGDYSSVNYDFALKCMPVFRYASDLEEYQNDRDLYFSFDAYPYPCAQSNDELEDLILHFDEQSYLDNLQTFLDKIGAVREKDASEKVAGLILDYIHGKNKSDFFSRNKDKFVYKNED